MGFFGIILVATLCLSARCLADDLADVKAMVTNVQAMVTDVKAMFSLSVREERESTISGITFREYRTNRYTDLPCFYEFRKSS